MKQETRTVSSLPYSRPDFNPKADDKFEKRKRCKMHSCAKQIKTKCYNCLETFCDDHSARLCQKCYETHIEPTSLPYGRPDFKSLAHWTKFETRKRCKIRECKKTTKLKCHYCLEIFCDNHSARLCKKCYEK